MGHRRAARVVCLAAVALLATSCAPGSDGPADVAVAAPAATADPSGGDANATTASAAAPTIPAGETLATFSESEVIGFLRVTSADGVDQARFAELRAEDPAVRAFAAEMIADHTRVLGRLVGLRPPFTGPDPTSALVQREEQVVSLDLQVQQGASVFELAYMTRQLGAAARMIAMLDRSLLPSVAAARATRAVLLDVRAMYVRHLVEALDLQQRILRSALTAGTTDTSGGGGGDPGSSLRITPHK
jgi:predicted outer membrane protein